MSRERTLRVGTEHELLASLYAAGILQKDADNIITSRGNELAKALVQLARNGGLPIPANGGVTGTNLPVPSQETREFPVWRTVNFGKHASTEELSQALKDGGFRISDWANRILLKTPLAPQPTCVDVVLVTVADLGFPKGARRDAIYARAQELGLQLCPAEVGPALRLQYADQPKNEWIYIGMEPILDSDGYPSVFDVGHDSGGRWLSSDCGRPDSEWDAGDRWVFSRK